MKKQESHNRKELEKRLVSLMLIYLNGLKDKKRKRLSDYMEDKLGSVLDYYLSLLNKKERKTFLLQGLSDEILFHHLTLQEEHNAVATKADDLKN